MLYRYEDENRRMNKGNYLVAGDRHRRGLNALARFPRHIEGTRSIGLQGKTPITLNHPATLTPASPTGAGVTGAGVSSSTGAGVGAGDSTGDGVVGGASPLRYTVIALLPPVDGTTSGLKDGKYIKIQ